MNSINNYHLLVVDDDPLIVDALRLALPKHWQMTSAKSAKHLEELLEGKLIYHAAFVDMHLSNKPAAEGPEIIKRIAQTNSKIEIIAISGDLSLDLMESCLENGAKKFLAKPLVTAEVLSTLEKIEALWMMRLLENRGANSHINLIGTSAAAEKIRSQIAALRGEVGPILIEGETGTGKEIVAQLLNAQESLRPFLAVNVAAIPENLFESEMFGHIKGAFTGAEQTKIGLAEAASGGDLFLDEIEALALPLQVKLLRFLESGEIRRVGAKESLHVKTRVVCASNQSLDDLVKEGKFREDLFFRLGAKRVRLPSLRERTEDIPDLTQYFLGQLRPRINKQFSPEALANLKKYSFPGNIRELKRICEQLALTAPLPIVRSQDIQALLATTPMIKSDLDYEIGLAGLVENFEAQIITEVLQKTQDIDNAGNVLKVSRSTLYKKIKDYNITTSLRAP